MYAAPFHVSRDGGLGHVCGILGGFLKCFPSPISMVPHVMLVLPFVIGLWFQSNALTLFLLNRHPFFR